MSGQVKLSITGGLEAPPAAPVLLRGSMDQLFLMARQLGYDGLELHLLRADDIERSQLLRLARDHGVAVSAIGTGKAASVEGLSFSSPDPQIRLRAVKRIQGQIELAACLGSSVIIGLVYGMLAGSEGERERQRQTALDCLGECAGAAKREGVNIFLEPLNRYESNHLNTLADARFVVDKVGVEEVRILADTFHMNIEEADIHRSLMETAGYLGHVHLADSNRQAPGHGHLEMRKILTSLRECRYAGYLSFEVLPIPGPQEAGRDAIRTVRGMLEAIG